MKNTPLKIGSVTTENPFVLAPLAGYTDLPFRLLCLEYGAGMVVSEMISCHGLTYMQQKTWDMIKSTPADHPIAIQLFGSEPEIMGRAAALLNKEPIDCIDINMGCPVRKVIKKGAGSALMKTPDLAAEIIRQVCANSTKPVTVKFRAGWNHQCINAPEFAQMAEESGAQALTIHGRTWSDGFSGKADWDIIAQTKQSVSIPVIGNGDILSYEQGLAMMKQSGCDGVMIGRAALGKPWVFSEDSGDNPPLLFRLQALKRHLELIREHSNPQWALAKTKNHAGRYFKGLAHGAAVRNRIYQMKTFFELEELVTALITES